MIKLYKASEYLHQITPIEATRKTGSNYFDLDFRRKERRNALVGNTFHVFETEQEAITWLRNKLTEKVRLARQMVEYSNRELDRFNEKYPI